VLVGCHGGALGPDLEQLGIDVRYLGPRKQLELFEG